MLNLVNNAVKFTSEGEIVVEITTNPIGENRWEIVFAVRDTGIGIPLKKWIVYLNHFLKLTLQRHANFGEQDSD